MSRTSAKPDPFDAALDNAQLPEKSVEVCLRGDLVAEVENLERDLRDLRSKSETLAERGRVRQVAEKIEKAREAMREASIVFRLRGLTRDGWTELLGAHPPRDGEKGDKLLGYNVKTFFPALIRACLVDPAVTDEQWERLDARLSAGQFDELAEAALAVSRRKVDVPFSFAASATLRNSDETSSAPSA